MTEADKALEALNKAREDSDLDEIRAACRTLLETDAAPAIKHQAQYELGLCHLWRKENMEEAIALFSEVAKKPEKDDLSHTARASLSICLWHTGQKSKAIFELRKMIPKGCPPTMHTATALDFLYLFLKDSSADPQSLKQTQVLRLTHLRHLQQEADNPESKAAWSMRLAVALAEVGDGPSTQSAKKLCQEILSQKAVLTDELINQTQNLMKGL